jgi:dTDP-4-dehydrorhamnose 3,5-epimerase
MNLSDAVIGTSEKFSLDILKNLVFGCAVNLDSRGEFSRVFDIEEIQKVVSDFSLEQVSFSRSFQKNTRRGMHVQIKPSEEIKVVRVLKGSLIDVIIDTNLDSINFGKWAMFYLDAKIGDGLIVPSGFAHGIHTLEDETVVAYGMNVKYDPQRDTAISSSDLDLNIPWGHPIHVISEKDRTALNWKAFKGLLLQQ